MRPWSWNAEYIRVDDFPNGNLKSLAAHWFELCERLDETVPEAQDFEIGRFDTLLPHLALVDATDLDHPRYIAVGAALVRLLGRDPTDRLLGDVYRTDVYTEIRNCFARSVIEARPLLYRREFQMLGRSLGYDRLVMPLRRNRMVTRLMIGIYPIDGTLVRAGQWLDLIRGVEEQDTRNRRFAGLWAADVGATAAVDPAPSLDPFAAGGR